MPRRRSDKPSIFGTDDPSRMHSIAEFTEPYGTISGLNDIRKDPSDPWNYIFALPIIGDAARFGKKAGKIGPQQNPGPNELRQQAAKNEADKRNKQWDKTNQVFGPLEDWMDDLIDTAEDAEWVRPLQDRYDEMFDAYDMGNGAGSPKFDEALAEFMRLGKDEYVLSRGSLNNLSELASDPNVLADIITRQNSGFSEELFRKGAERQLNTFEESSLKNLKSRIMNGDGAARQQLRDLHKSDPELVAAAVAQKKIAAKTIKRILEGK